jgi:hypothetical protein
LLACIIAMPAAAFQKPEDLPAGHGRDEVFYLCSACHSFQLVSRQGMSRSLWDDTLRLMVEKHGMPEPSQEERAVILDYLASAYPPPKKRGWQNPFQGK